MKLLKQPNRWSCLLTSFAMAIDFEENILIEKIGHDGSEVIWPELPDPLRRRSFSIHELIKASYQLGWYTFPTAVQYFSMPDYDVEPITYKQSKEYVDEVMRRHDGVITGLTKSGGRHAVAWNREQVFDPCGSKYCKEDFMVEVFWAVIPIGALPP